MFSLAGLQKGLRSTLDLMGGSSNQKTSTENTSTSATVPEKHGDHTAEDATTKPQGKKRLNILKKKAFIMFIEDENLQQFSKDNNTDVTSNKNNSGNNNLKKSKSNHPASTSPRNEPESPYHPIEPVPTSLIKKPYWQLRCIERSIKTGGFLSPDLFLPKQAWDQSHLKIAGYSAKMSAFQAIHLLLTEIQVTFSEIASTSPDKIYNIVSNLVEEFRGIQNQLTQPFSFVPAVAMTHAPAEDSEEAEAQVRYLSYAYVYNS